MKAVCKERILEYIGNKIFIVEPGDIVDYTVRDKKFIVKNSIIPPALFFAKFKVIEGDDKMTYSDFEYIICNYVFYDAVLFPNEYNGVRHLIVQMYGGVTIMINISENENVIRVSYPHCQKNYTDFESALDGIKQMGKGRH